MKKKNTTTKVLMLLEVALEYIGRIDEYFANPYKRVYNLPHPKDSIRLSLYRLKKKGAIKEKRVKGERIIMTTKAAEEIVPWITLYRLSRKKWDGYWRVVAFDIPEKERKTRRLIRGKLYELGFRQFQRSIWISPLPVRQPVLNFLKSLGLEKRVVIFETRNLWAGDIEEIVEKLWQTEKMKKEWQEWIQKVKTRQKNQKLLKTQFFSLLERTPLLPKNFYPKDWPFKEACRVYFDNVQ